MSVLLDTSELCKQVSIEYFCISLENENLHISHLGPNCYDTSGEAEDKWSNVLVASGFEVYGILKEKTTVQENIVQDVRDLLTQVKHNIEIQQLSRKESQPKDHKYMQVIIT